MKPPYLNYSQRQEIYLDTTLGAGLWLDFTIKKALRDVYNECGIIQYLLFRNTVLKLNTQNNDKRKNKGI